MPRSVQRFVAVQFFKIIPKEFLCSMTGYKIPADCDQIFRLHINGAIDLTQLTNQPTNQKAI